MGLLDFFKRSNPRKSPEDYFTVNITEDFVAVEHPRRDPEQIRRVDIQTIKIITTDQGPMLRDVWLALLGTDSGCLIPQGAKGYDEVYDIVSKYDGFNFENVINGMSSADNREFLL